MLSYKSLKTWGIKAEEGKWGAEGEGEPGNGERERL
jgi:hypothetical protein